MAVSRKRRPRRAVRLAALDKAPLQKGVGWAKIRNATRQAYASGWLENAVPGTRVKKAMVQLRRGEITLEDFIKIAKHRE